MAKRPSLGTQADFFRRLREGSRVKQKIVADYFVYYNRVMARRNEKVGYADLFAGPGSYTDDSGGVHESTPVLVTKAAISEPLFRDKVHLWFNDGDMENHERLKETIESIPGVGSLVHAPTITGKIIDSQWPRKMERVKVPTLVFLDPCGYKGLSLRLVKSILKGYGNDCIFFFNYSRINMKLDLEIMNNSIDEFFEPARSAVLRSAIQDKSPQEREDLILASVRSALEEARGIPQCFRFVSERNRTSHHLFFASKDPRAAAAMKRTFNAASSTVTEGVGSGEHDPRARDRSGLLFAGLYEVQDQLLDRFHGRRIQFGRLLEEESRSRFTDSNYRDAILELERNSRVTVNPPAESRRWQAGGLKRSLPLTAYITFPERSKNG